MKSSNFLLNLFFFFLHYKWVCCYATTTTTNQQTSLQTKLNLSQLKLLQTKLSIRLAWLAWLISWLVSLFKLISKLTRFFKLIATWFYKFWTCKSFVYKNLSVFYFFISLNSFSSSSFNQTDKQTSSS